jgi:hypothetical protein
MKPDLRIGMASKFSCRASDQAAEIPPRHEIVQISGL